MSEDGTSQHVPDRGAAKPAASDSPPQGAPRYCDAALPSHQLHLTDLVPTRLPWLFAVVASLLAMTAGVALLFHYAGPRFAQFDLTGPGTLAAWFVSLLWVGASLLAALIYSLRRHRLDDYQGRYRIWLWITACCLLASVNTTTGLDRLVSRGARHAALWLGLGDFGLAEASFWWLAPLALAPALVFAKALLDARECRGAMIAALLAAVLGAAALCIATGQIAVGGEHLAVLIRGALTISGAVVVVAALLLYARYVLLDAQGLLAQKAPRIKNWAKTGDSLTEEREAERANSTDEHADEHRRVAVTRPAVEQAPRPAAAHHNSPRRDHPGKTTHPRLAKHSTEKESAASAGFDEKTTEFDDEITTLRAKNELSKAERRRLKKLLRRRQAA